MFWRFVCALLWRIFNLKNLYYNDYAKRTKSYYSDFMIYNQYLIKNTGKKLEKYYNLRLLEIDRILKTKNITSIIEIGTGRTTFFFAKVTGVTLKCYEQNSDWVEIVSNGLTSVGAYRPPIILSDVIEHKAGGKFLSLLPEHVDLLYIDGPFIKNPNMHFATHTKKPAYYDFETFFENGIFPKIIMIEGRTDTADAILQSRFSYKYRFIPEFQHAIQRQNLAGALKFSRHSIFELK